MLIVAESVGGRRRVGTESVGCRRRVGTVTVGVWCSVRWSVSILAVGVDAGSVEVDAGALTSP